MAEGLIGPGFYPQPNEWTCGPFALKHALLALGRMVDVTQISTTARTHWWSGTNEIQLARAARASWISLVPDHQCVRAVEAIWLTSTMRPRASKACLSANGPHVHSFGWG